MKKKVFLYFFFIMQFSFLFGENNMLEIKKLLTAAESDLVRYPAPWELMYPDSCKKIKQIINDDYVIGINILIDKSVSNLQKQILINIFSYEVNFEKYADVLLTACDFYLNNDIDFYIFQYMFECPIIRQVIKKEYKNKKIQLIIKKSLQNNLTKDEKQFFMNLKKGKI